MFFDRLKSNNINRLVIDKAPAKDLIPKIIESKSYDSLIEFYRLRVDWYGYPLIHDRFVTYGLFQDLINKLSDEKDSISIFIDISVLIAEQENDKRFLNSIFLVSNFCKIAKKLNVKPTQNQINRLVNLVNRVKKMSFLPNLSVFWDLILDFLSMDIDFNKTDYSIDYNSYLSEINMDFPSIDNNTSKSCPVNIKEIEKKTESIVGEFEPLTFVRSAVIDNNKYWVWIYKNINISLKNWYFTVIQDEQNKILIEGHMMLGGINTTPEKLMLEYYYRL